MLLRDDLGQEPDKNLTVYADIADISGFFGWPFCMLMANTSAFLRYTVFLRSSRFILPSSMFAMMTSRVIDSTLLRIVQLKV